MKRILVHAKYITTKKFNKLTTEKFYRNIKQGNLASKNGISALVKKHFDHKLINLNKKVTSFKNKTCRGWKENN